MSNFKGKYYLYLAMLIGLLFHGVTVFFTFEKTYDAFVHIFFASHYVENWFDVWNYKWYTGFTMVSYPPLIHQSLALISSLVGLKTAFVLLSTLMTMLFIRGVYVFSKLWVNPQAAGMAAIAAVVCSSFVEALHIFGQLPSISGITLLLNATPFIYKWILEVKWRDLIISLLFLSVITATHHVSTIFGMVFFLFPVIGLAWIDRTSLRTNGIQHIKFKDLLREFFRIIPPALCFGILSLVTTVITILPYWLWSRYDPITQVPIPHGSRDNFIEVFSSGLVFFIIPWGLTFFILPFVFKEIYKRRNLILGLSFTLCFILGTGGTTPIPLKLLGETAFNILTLDRFTFWATLMALPFTGAFLFSLFFGEYRIWLRKKIGTAGHKIIVAFWVLGSVLTSVFVINVSHFQPLQPDTIETKPLENFLARDQHDEWRYLTLGFGDQMAWLSANTNALTVDGNYHSVRRLPEFTSRKVERLENSKYMGEQGLSALKQFLISPEKYNLKYIFSNDQFYDPILHFTGWQYVGKLENDVAVWQKPDINMLPKLLPRKEIPAYQSKMWGIIPLSSVTILLLLLLLFKIRPTTYLKKEVIAETKPTFFKLGSLDLAYNILLFVILLCAVIYGIKQNNDQSSPENVITAYFDAIDYKEFKKAFSLFDPEDSPSIDQMLLDLSVKNGIILSYAKLSEIEIKEKQSNTNRKKYQVKANWISAINTFSSYHDFEVTQKKNKWWINFDKRDLKTAPNQNFSNPSIDFKNQGRRELSLNNTSHADILDRPEIVCNHVKLIEENGQFHVIGKCTNIDNDPAYFTLNSSLLDKNGNVIIKANSDDIIQYHLLPKESSYFRIDFQDKAYQKAFTQYSDEYKPALESPYIYLGSPDHFILEVKSSVTSGNLNHYYGIDELKFNEQKITGVFINSDIEECTIPRLLYGIYENDELIWVGHQYLQNAIKAQQYQSFTLTEVIPPEIQQIKGSELPLIVINGQNAEDINQKKKESYQKSNSLHKSLNQNYLVDIIPTGFIRNR